MPFPISYFPRSQLALFKHFLFLGKRSDYANGQIAELSNQLPPRNRMSSVCVGGWVMRNYFWYGKRGGIYLDLNGRWNRVI